MPRERHLMLDLHRLRQQIDCAEVRIRHVASEFQLADILTKARATDRLIRNLAEGGKVFIPPDDCGIT